jgi:hypothetical protein
MYNTCLVTSLDMDRIDKFGGIFENQFYLYVEGKLELLFFLK